MSRHFVVQLENRPGELAHLARALAARGIDIQHIAGGGAGSVGFAFLATDDEAATEEVLQGMGLRFIDGETIVVEYDDVPGGLASIADRLAEAGIDISSLMIIGRCGTRVQIALVVDDPEKARHVLGPEHVIAA